MKKDAAPSQNSNQQAHLPVLEEVAGAEAVVWKVLQSHTRSGVVVHIDYEVGHGEHSLHNADYMSVQGRMTGPYPLPCFTEVNVVAWNDGDMHQTQGLKSTATFGQPKVPQNSNP